jgi:hypothetical protein
MILDENAQYLIIAAYFLLSKRKIGKRTDNNVYIQIYA